MPIKISWHGKHFGEEPPLVGSEKQGSGTIFFSHCNLKCVFCQNYQISQEGLGKPCSIEGLADMMLGLQEQGAVNINLVSPTLWWQSIAKAIRQIRPISLMIPVVWNSNGYESVAMLKELEGLVDIYLPDFKYSDDSLALKYSGVKNYTQTALTAITEMWRQTGLLTTRNGIAQKGLIVRHLVLPRAVQNSLGVLNLLKKIDTQIHISLMSQYQPLFKAKCFPELIRPLSQEEFDCVHNHLINLEFENGWVQELKGKKSLVPDFEKKVPFTI